MREIIANEDENDKGGIWTKQFLQGVDKPPREDTCNDCKFVQRVVPLASVANLATKWHKLHWFNI